MANSWDRQPGETDLSWDTFQLYRDLDLPRPTLRHFAENLGGRPSHVSIKGWAKRFSWRDRIYDFDQHIAGEKHEIRVMGVELKDHISDGEAEDYDHMRELWLLGVDKVRGMLESNDPDTVSKGVERINQIAMSRMRISNIARRAAKMPTDYKEDPDDDSGPSKPMALTFEEGPMSLPDGSDDYDSIIAAASQKSEDSSGEPDEV